MELKDNSGKIKFAIEKATKAGLTAAALIVEAQAKALTPVDTGLLRDSIFHEVDDTSATIGSPTEYAEHVEFGTKYQTAQPFLRAAFRENKSNIEKILGQHLRDEMGDI